jgi:hypothetical protein
MTRTVRLKATLGSDLDVRHNVQQYPASLMLHAQSQNLNDLPGPDCERKDQRIKDSVIQRRGERRLNFFCVGLARFFTLA